jgi:asparagine synthase (glutamine-hydrolysing)
MCGIAGHFYPNLPHAPHHCQPQKIAHRGPDERHTITLPFLHMTTHRLSIVSQSDGTQPLADPRSSWIVSMNGEIYNYKTLAREAQANGFPPQNPSDTATLAALLCFLPLDQVLNRMRGMFALALFHTPSQTLYIVRDRMGVKPLYWNLRDGQFSWSSELSGLPTQGLAVNPIAASQLLMFEYIPAPETIIEETYKLRPGSLVRFSGSSVEQETWYQPPSISDDIHRDIVPWEKSFLYSVHSALRLRIPDNLPTVIQLSGGIDSSLLATLLPNPKESIAYTLSIQEKGMNESQKANTVAASLSIPLREVSFHRRDFLDTAQAALAHLSEPIADSSVLPYWKLMKQMKLDGVRCVISGDGADESLGGYPTYDVLNWAHLLHPLRFPLSKFLNIVPKSHRPLSRRNMAKRMVDGLHHDWWKQQQLWMGAWLPQELHHGRDEKIWQSTKYWAQKAQGNRFSKALYLDQRTYLAEGVLQKVDRISMAFGIEVRSPFMDDRLVSLMASLPQNCKRPSKQIMRNILKQHNIPSSIYKQPKQGFGAPLGMWISDIRFSEQHHSLLSPYLSSTILNQAIKEHRQGLADNRRKIWSAYCLAIWLENREKSNLK